MIILPELPERNRAFLKWRLPLVGWLDGRWRHSDSGNCIFCNSPVVLHLWLVLIFLHGPNMLHTTDEHDFTKTSASTYLTGAGGIGCIAYALHQQCLLSHISVSVQYLPSSPCPPRLQRNKQNMALGGLEGSNWAKNVLGCVISLLK